MKDNLSIFITMIVFVTLMVIFPLYNYFERQDDMSYNLTLKATTNFVDSVVNSGYIDQQLYDKFVQELANTGMYYDIELEAQRRVYTKDPYEVGKPGVDYDSIPFVEQYYSDYNNDIFEEDTGKTIENTSSVDPSTKKLKNSCYYLNKGDKIFVKLKNSTTTMAGAIFSIIVPTSSTERIKVNYGGIVKNNAWEETPQSRVSQGDIYIKIKQKNDATTVAADGKVTVTVTVSMVNSDENVNRVADILQKNMKLIRADGSNVNPVFVKENGVVKLGDVWEVSFEIPSDYATSQYRAVLPSGNIQGKVNKNLETTSDTLNTEKTE